MIGLYLKKIISIFLIITQLYNFSANLHADLQREEALSYVVKIESAHMFFGISDGFVYFGRNTCPFCYRFLPLLYQVANEERIKVFYFDTSHFRDYNLLTNDELQEVFARFQITHVPIVIRLTDGQLYDIFTPPFLAYEDSTSMIKESTRDFLNTKNN